MYVYDDDDIVAETERRTFWWFLYLFITTASQRQQHKEKQKISDRLSQNFTDFDFVWGSRGREGSSVRTYISIVLALLLFLDVVVFYCTIIFSNVVVVVVARVLYPRVIYVLPDHLTTFLIHWPPPGSLFSPRSSSHYSTTASSALPKYKLKTTSQWQRINQQLTKQNE